MQKKRRQDCILNFASFNIDDRLVADTRFNLIVKISLLIFCLQNFCGHRGYFES